MEILAKVWNGWATPNITINAADTARNIDDSGMEQYSESYLLNQTIRFLL